jgi:hypothetical protein
MLGEQLSAIGFRRSDSRLLGRKSTCTTDFTDAADHTDKKGFWAFNFLERFSVLAFHRLIQSVQIRVIRGAAFALVG